MLLHCALPANANSNKDGVLVTTQHLANPCTAAGGVKNVALVCSAQ
jgi:hypothetical protein